MLWFYQRLVWCDVVHWASERASESRVTYLVEQFIREIGETHKKSACGQKLLRFSVYLRLILLAVACVHTHTHTHTHCTHNNRSASKNSIRFILSVCRCIWQLCTHSRKQNYNKMPQNFFRWADELKEIIKWNVSRFPYRCGVTKDKRVFLLFLSFKTEYRKIILSDSAVLHYRSKNVWMKRARERERKKVSTNNTTRGGKKSFER